MVKDEAGCLCVYSVRHPSVMGFRISMAARAELQGEYLRMHVTPYPWK